MKPLMKTWPTKEMSTTCHHWLKGHLETNIALKFNSYIPTHIVFYIFLVIFIADVCQGTNATIRGLYG